MTSDKEAKMVAGSLTGSAFALARWFQPEHDVSGPHDDEERDSILNEVYQATVVGVRGNTVLALTPNGACMIEREDVGGSPLVTFDYVENNRWTRTRFWMNASSVRSLGEQLRSLPRRPFDELFIGAAA